MMEDTVRQQIESVSALLDRFYRARANAVEGRGLEPENHRESLIFEEQVVATSLEQNGFNLLGVGAGRAVFQIPETQKVVKVARFGSKIPDSGKGQNKNEYQTYTTADASLNLAPVLGVEADYLWLVMPEADKIEEFASEEEAEQLADALSNQLFNADVFIKLLDVRVENMGVFDGEVYLIDYGLSGQ